MVTRQPIISFVLFIYVFGEVFTCFIFQSSSRKMQKEENVVKSGKVGKICDAMSPDAMKTTENEMCHNENKD